MQRTPSFFEGVSTDAVEAVLAEFARRDFDAGALILAIAAPVREPALTAPATTFG
jgi:hypothetical protein